MPGQDRSGPGGPDASSVGNVLRREPEENAPPLPLEVIEPFAVTGRNVVHELGLTIENAARRDGVRVAPQQADSQHAGAIGRVPPGVSFEVPDPDSPGGSKWVPLRYELVLNSEHPAGVKYASLAHELGHLYSGHLGTPDSTWWPDRRGGSESEREFEAESVSFLACERLGVTSPSAAYRSNYLQGHADTPAISLNSVMRAAGLIVEMGRRHIEDRKPLGASRRPPRRVGLGAVRRTE